MSMLLRKTDIMDDILTSCNRVCSCECSEKTQKKCVTFCKAIFVRLLLIAHNVLAVWRVTLAYGNGTYWLLALGTILIAWEGQYTILKNDGVEWKWICPCFFFYLGTTLPAIWLLEISQMNNYLESTKVTDTMTAVSNILVNTTINITNSSLLDIDNGTDSDNTWIVAIEETLIYLIVLGRWMLPRGEVSREALSDLLLDYLAMASDIMELFGLFDQDEIRGNKIATYAILSIWSISFIQFIPVIYYKRIYRIYTPAHNSKGLINACGDGFVEIFATCMAIFLQDGPFLILRLWIIIYLDIITYSLMFFVVKNIMVILLLAYKVLILCVKMPCCFEEEGEIESVISVDLNIPVKVPSLPDTNQDNINNFDVKTSDDNFMFY